jgi:ABC-type uncharacterized transport system substrate-binding protein
MKNHRLSRVLRAWLTLLVAAVLPSAVCAFADTVKGAVPTVVVVTSSHVAAYEEALEGLRQRLGATTRLVVIDLDGAPDSLAQKLDQSNPRLVVTVGGAATRATADAGPGIPVLATMVVRSQGGLPLAASAAGRGLVGVVSLDLPFRTVLGEIRTLFPDKNRVGVIYSKASSGIDESALQAEAKRVGVSLTAVHCKGPEEVVDALVSLKHSADIVWCPPDGTLFNATTVKPLIMASLRHQILIAGFSEGFVRAGTAMGIYPDFEAVGRQTASAVRQYLDQGLLPGEQAASDARVAINERVLRLLGVNWQSLAGHGDGVTLLK